MAVSDSPSASLRLCARREDPLLESHLCWLEEGRHGGLPLRPAFLEVFARDPADGGEGESAEVDVRRVQE
jgi:hypothetical protein